MIYVFFRLDWLAVSVRLKRAANLWSSSGFNFCDGDSPNTGKVDARGGLGVPQDYAGMVGLAGGGGAGGPGGHLYGPVSSQDSK